VNDPSIILADEPTGALDSRTSIEIMAIFQRLNREKGITMIVVTHDPDIAAYSNRSIHFKDGKLQLDPLWVILPLVGTQLQEVAVLVDPGFPFGRAHDPGRPVALQPVRERRLVAPLEVFLGKHDEAFGAVDQEVAAQAGLDADDGAIQELMGSVAAMKGVAFGAEDPLRSRGEGMATWLGGGRT